MIYFMPLPDLNIAIITFIKLSKLLEELSAMARKQLWFIHCPN